MQCVEVTVSVEALRVHGGKDKEVKGDFDINYVNM